MISSQIYRPYYFIAFNLLLGLTLIFSSCKNKPIKTKTIHIKSIDDIKSLDSNLIIPYDYQNIVSLKELDVKEKKRKFIDLLLPSILIAKKRIELTQYRLTSVMEKDSSNISKSDAEFLSALMKKYKAKTFDDLHSKLNTHPNSIIIAQSALESGWGSSRFFVEASNPFGIWSFNKNELRIKAGDSRDGKNIYLKKYNSLSESIEDYFLTIAKGPYKDFRKLRETNNNPYNLILQLYRYSETGDKYIESLRDIIKKNHLTQYDDYVINPKYLK